MRHQIVSDDLRAPEMAEAVEKCVHCGFCLAACPTYNLLGEEMDSPRGRIYLMKNVLEENLPAAEAQPYIDRCLGCMACVPACPRALNMAICWSVTAPCKRKSGSARRWMR